MQHRSVARIDLVLDREKAAELKLDPERQSDMGYYWPSLEYFVDCYVQDRIGFNSSYDDQETVSKWCDRDFWQAAEYLGIEIALAMVALCESAFAYEHEVFMAHDPETWLGMDDDAEQALYDDIRNLLADMLAKG